MLRRPKHLSLDKWAFSEPFRVGAEEAASSLRKMGQVTSGRLRNKASFPVTWEVQVSAEDADLPLLAQVVSQIARGQEPVASA